MRQTPGLRRGRHLSLHSDRRAADECSNQCHDDEFWAGPGLPHQAAASVSRRRETPGADMCKVIAGITISVDGYIAGPDDWPGNGLGVGGERLHNWVFGGPWTYDARPEGEATGEDQAGLEQAMAGLGAVVGTSTRSRGWVFWICATTMAARTMSPPRSCASRSSWPGQTNPQRVGRPRGAGRAHRRRPRAHRPRPARPPGHRETVCWPRSRPPSGTLSPTRSNNSCSPPATPRRHEAGTRRLPDREVSRRGSPVRRTGRRRCPR